MSIALKNNFLDYKKLFAHFAWFSIKWTCW